MPETIIAPERFADVEESVRVSITGGGEFLCLPGESLLKAALRAGYAAPYECASGTCGSCKTRLMEGKVEMRWAGATGLSDRDRTRGDRILCCQAVPAGDCTIQLRAGLGNDEPVPESLSGKILAIDELCAGVRRIRVGCDRAVSFLAGQFMLVRFPAPIGFRAYSMANEPAGGAEIEFIVKAKSGGAGSARMFGDLRPGDLLPLEGPYGRGYWRAKSVRPIVAVAGGSGLAPMLSIARAALRANAASVHLFFGVERPQEMFARDELSNLATRYPQFRLTVAVRNGPADGSHGLREGTIGDVMIEDRTDLAGCDLYMAGPSAMIDSLVAETIRCGKIPADRVFFDRFS